MTALIATICDLQNVQVARVEAAVKDQNLVVQIVSETPSCREIFSEVDQDRLQFMIDGMVYLETSKNGRKSFRALHDLVGQLSNHMLRLRYDAAGVERGHELMREIAKQRAHYVPVSELFDIIRQPTLARS